MALSVKDARRLELGRGTAVRGDVDNAPRGNHTAAGLMKECHACAPPACAERLQAASAMCGSCQDRAQGAQGPNSKINRLNPA